MEVIELDVNTSDIPEIHKKAMTLVFQGKHLDKMTNDEKASYYHSIVMASIQLIGEANGPKNTAAFIDFVKQNYPSYEGMPYITIEFEEKCDCPLCMMDGDHELSH